jgi:hypothetical protein
MTLRIIDGLTPAQYREAAERLMQETAHRGILVRVNAALVARQLHERADSLERSR